MRSRLSLPSFALLLALSPLLTPGSLRAAPVEVTLTGGEFLSGATGVEAYGASFAVAFPGLPEGEYTVEVEAAERFHDTAGARVMTVTSGETVLGANIDLFKETGGKDKSLTLRAKVVHAADSMRGPLTVSFAAVKDNAKFDRVRVLDAGGREVARADAGALKLRRDRVDPALSAVPVVTGPEIWKDTTKSPVERATDMARRLSVVEKIAQIQMSAPAVPRVGITAYDWWNEALHGVARVQRPTTVFPQAIGLASTWNTSLEREVATVISDEARAIHHAYADAHGGATPRYYGLDVWSPNVNIFRDPRWGRGQETYGEDPYLTGRMGVAFVKGLQGDDSRHLKIAATPKHFAVHSGPEKLRHEFDAKADARDLWETYLPAFEACFVEGKAVSVMGAYNRFNGESASASKLLLIDILRGKWGFDGVVVSDVDSVADIHGGHRLVKTPAEAAAHALKNGMDLNGGSTFRHLATALRDKLVTTEDIDRAFIRAMTVRFRLGMFDPKSSVKWASVDDSSVDGSAHDDVALRAARESIVLLQNPGAILPLSKEKTKTVALLGPNADDINILVGNYNGIPSRPVSILSGLYRKLDTTRVLVGKGCDLVAPAPNTNVWFGKLDVLQRKQWMADALENARRSDAVVLALGNNALLEGEETDCIKAEGFELGDRTAIGLPKPQLELLEAVLALKKPTVLVLANGCAIGGDFTKHDNLAVVEAWYPGQRGGDAVADILFGDYNPAGRLPVTFYKSEKDLPSFTDYSMTGRTYRYFTGEPLYAFGHGLSYTTFGYNGVAVQDVAGGDRIVSVRVKNTGKLAGDEVVQLYVSRADAPADSGLPVRSLRGFKRIHLAPGETKTVTFRLTPFQFAFADKDGARVAEGSYSVGIGGGQKAAQSVTVKFDARVVNPPYAHFAPEVK